MTYRVIHCKECYVHYNTSWLCTKSTKQEKTYSCFLKQRWKFEQLTTHSRLTIISMNSPCDDTLQPCKKHIFIEKQPDKQSTPFLYTFRDYRCSIKTDMNRPSAHSCWISAHVYIHLCATPNSTVNCVLCSKEQESLFVGTHNSVATHEVVCKDPITSAAFVSEGKNCYVYAKHTGKGNIDAERWWVGLQ